MAYYVDELFNAKVILKKTEEALFILYLGGILFTNPSARAGYDTR